MMIPIALVHLIAFQQFAPSPAESPLIPSRASESENCWVALIKGDGEKEISFGYIYIDPEAGWTYHWVGSFEFDKSGELVRGKDAMDNKASFKMRLENDFNVQKISKTGQEQLKLQGSPEWYKHYKIDKPSPANQTHWGSCYNHIGRPDLAISYLLLAQNADATTKGLAFELGFAYNALGQFDNAIRILSVAAETQKNDHLIIGELAYAYLGAKNFTKAIENYLIVISICPIDMAARKAEYAMNLAQAYSNLGDITNRDKWLNNAKQWAPEGSQVAQFFKSRS